MSQKALTLHIEMSKEDENKPSGRIENAEITMYTPSNTDKIQAYAFDAAVNNNLLFRNMAFGIQSIHNKSYYKSGIEVCVNLLNGFCDSSDKGNVNHMESNPMKHMTKDGVPTEMMHEMRRLAQVMQWMINSTSWNSENVQSGEGEYYAFDKAEINYKLGRK